MKPQLRALVFAWLVLATGGVHLSRDSVTLLRRQARDTGSVLLLVTTAAHESYLSNLVTSFKQHGVQNYVIVTPDEPIMSQICAAQAWPCLFDKTNSTFNLARDRRALRHSRPARMSVPSRSVPGGELQQHSNVYNDFTWRRCYHGRDS